MSHARRARRVLAAMACTAAAASAGCRSPFHSFADGPRHAATEAVATIDRKDVPELAPAAVAPSAPAASTPTPAPEAVATIDPPAATPLLDAALRRAEAAEESRREAIREAQAVVRQPVVSPEPAPMPNLAPAPEPEAAAEPSPAPADSALEIKATVAPPAEETQTPPPVPEAAEAAVERPRSDPAVAPVSAEEPREATSDDVPEDATARPTPPAPTTAEPEPTPVAPSLPDALGTTEQAEPEDAASTAARPDEEGGPAPLTIEAAKLCRKIQGFGSYEPLKSSTLRPGRSALVYCELGGLEYRADGDGFTASVATRVELIRPADDQKVWEVADGAVDHSPTKRRDVYVGTLVTLPETIAPGEYTLRLYQADSTSGRTASTEIPVTIAR